MRVTTKLSLTLGRMTSDLELVWMHHPDSPRNRDIPSSLAQSRFQSITAAYDLLRNPHSLKLSTRREDDDPYMAEVNRRKAYYARHRGMGVRDWERQQAAMTVDVDAGKWWDHDRAVVYALGMIVRAGFSLVSRFKAYRRMPLVEYLDLSFLFKALGTAISHFVTPTASEMVDRQHSRTRTHLTEAKERGKGRREKIRRWLEESSESGEAGPYLNGFGDTRGRLPEGVSKNSQDSA
jgi:curved DNA-binding protein CbpA